MRNTFSTIRESLEVAEAKALQKQLLYDYAKKIKTLEAYDEFIRKYPEGQQYLDILILSHWTWYEVFIFFKYYFRQYPMGKKL